MLDLKKIWKNRKEIYEGLKNSVIRDNFVEDISAKRMAICKECPEIDLKGSECEVPGTQPCCGNCGCSLGFKNKSFIYRMSIRRMESINDRKTRR